MLEEGACTGLVSGPESTEGNFITQPLWPSGPIPSLSTHWPISFSPLQLLPLARLQSFKFDNVQQLVNI